MTTDHLALSGHAGAFSISPEAKSLLLAYLDRTRTAAAGDPDGDETVRDIEIAIGDRFRVATADGGTVDTALVTRIVDEFGPVVTDTQVRRFEKAPVLCRITEGKWFGGLCLALATRTEIRVDWLRTVAFLLALVTGGLLGIAYLITLLFVPRLDTVEQYRALLARQPPFGGSSRTPA